MRVSCSNCARSGEGQATLFSLQAMPDQETRSSRGRQPSLGSQVGAAAEHQTDPGR